MKGLPDYIGITGLATCGKSTVADYLTETFGYQRVSFAEPIKLMLEAGLGVSREDKEAKPPVLQGRTVRYAYQTLGTEWGRELIGADIWVDAAIEYASQRVPVVFDDMRFANEAQAVLNAGGVIWRIERPGLVAMNHVSESGIPDELVSCTLPNDQTPEQLLKLVFELLTQHANNQP